MATTTLERLRMGRYQAYQWRTELSTAQKLGLALGMACFVGLAAQVRIPLPWTPVPITAQTFAALMAGAMLGQWWGGASMALYVGLGMAGIPWFNGWTGGIAHVVGPTGGYIIGFILAALFVGYFTDKYVRARSFPVMLIIMLAANFVLIYTPGLLQLGLWLNLVKGQPAGLFEVLAMGLVPFIGGDLIKALAAATLAWGITPKKAYGREMDQPI